MSIQPRTLAQMQNRITAYEIAVNEQVVAYTSRKTKRCLYENIFKNLPLIRSLAENPGAPDKYSKDDGWTIGGNVRVYFTGRTERDAANSLLV